MISSPHALPEDSLPEQEILKERCAALQARVTVLEQQVQQTRSDLQAAQKELDDLAHFMAHDLRAPLRGVDGYSQALLQDYEGGLDEVGKAYLQFIRDSSRGASILIDRLLIYLRAMRGSLQIQPVDLSLLAQEAIERLRAENPAHRVDIQITPGLIVQADPRMMRILVNELIDNAWKFSARQPVAQIVFCTREEDGQAVFVIQDNGAGFKMEYAHRRFRPFERLHGAHEFDGTGLGLAICQRILERHAGRIWAYATPGQGARLSFTLPDTRPQSPPDEPG